MLENILGSGECSPGISQGYGHQNKQDLVWHTYIIHTDFSSIFFFVRVDLGSKLLVVENKPQHLNSISATETFMLNKGFIFYSRDIQQI